MITNLWSWNDTSLISSKTFRDYLTILRPPQNSIYSLAPPPPHYWKFPPKWGGGDPPPHLGRTSDSHSAKITSPPTPHFCGGQKALTKIVYRSLFFGGLAPNFYSSWWTGVENAADFEFAIQKLIRPSFYGE